MIVIYGNCQAGVYAGLLARICPSDTPVYYVRNFDHPTAEQSTLDDDSPRLVRLLLQQTEVREMPQFARIKVLTKGVPVLRFPPLDFNLLWPFNFADPRNKSEPPDFPFGRFPYGDRVVIELLREGLVGDAVWAAYMQRSIDRLPNLDRLAEMEDKRLTARDADADFGIGRYIMSNFRSERLFLTLNHPTGALLKRQFGDLLEASFTEIGVAQDARSIADKLFGNYQPFGFHHVPIHPEVANRLGLEWYHENMKFRCLDGRELTFEEMMRAYISFK